VRLAGVASTLADGFTPEAAAGVKWDERWDWRGVASTLAHGFTPQAARRRRRRTSIEIGGLMEHASLRLHSSGSSKMVVWSAIPPPERWTMTRGDGSVGKAMIELHHSKTFAETALSRIRWQVFLAGYGRRAKIQVERGSVRWLSTPTSSHQSPRTKNIARLAPAEAVVRQRSTRAQSGAVALVAAVTSSGKLL